MKTPRLGHAPFILILAIGTFPFITPVKADLVWGDVGNDLILTVNDNGAGAQVLRFNLFSQAQSTAHKSHRARYQTNFSFGYW